MTEVMITIKKTNYNLIIYNYYAYQHTLNLKMMILIINKKINLILINILKYFIFEYQNFN